MARKKVSKAFRSRLSEKLMDLGNLSLVSLAFGQFLSAGDLSVPLILSGFILPCQLR